MRTRLSGGVGGVQLGFSWPLSRSGSIDVENPDPAVPELPLVRQSRDAPVRSALSNSFGFGGTNASLLMQRI
jgi:3-oxoacyl-(acyl-carrier-protein) synthase